MNVPESSITNDMGHKQSFKKQALFGLLVAPGVLFITLWLFRDGAGPFWQWNLLDPGYFYLMDTLNLVNLRPPGHIAHPGVPVETLGALMMTLKYFGSSTGELTRAVLADPESHLRLISTAIIFLNALGLWALGYAAWRTFNAILPALAIQIAPFMSTLIIKHGYLPKPEGMLVFATLIFMSVIILALNKDRFDLHRWRFAMAFGMVAGFSVAIKITSAPLYILPVFLLGDWRKISLYGAVAALSFLLFTLPAMGAYQEFLDNLSHIVLGAGAYGAGPQTVIDISAYPDNFWKLLKRPALKIPIILAVITFAVTYFRKRIRTPPQEFKILVCVCLTLIAHVMVVAKQPNAFYMIPSYMLSALAVLLSLRLLWSLRPETARLPVSGFMAGAVLLGAFVIVQSASLTKRHNQLHETRKVSAAWDEAAFSHCARIYIYSASNPVYALYLADRVTGLRFSKVLKELYPAHGQYWIDDWYDPNSGTLRNWDGEQKFEKILNTYPCLLLRGTRPSGIQRYLQRAAPSIKNHKNCTRSSENIFTIGADCNGEIQP